MSGSYHEGIERIKRDPQHGFFTIERVAKRVMMNDSVYTDYLTKFN